MKKGKWSRAAYFVCRKTAVLIGDGRSRRGNREADSWLSLYVSKTAVLIGDGRSRVREQEVASVKKGKWSRAA